MDVAILYNLPTRRGQASGYVVADTDTEESAKKIYDAIGGHVSAKLVSVTEDTIENIKNIHADIIFNLIEWDGLDLPLSLQAIDYIVASHIPYTGATKHNFEETTDKLRMKKAFDVHDLPTSPWQAFYTGTERIKKDFHYPVIVKLSQTHCSIGLDGQAVVIDGVQLSQRVRERIASFHQPVIAEEFISGREFQVTMLEQEHGLVMLPPAEIFFDSDGANKFLTFDSRWTAGASDYKTSHIKMADLNSVFAMQMESICFRAFRELRFRDYARFDIRTIMRGKTNEIYFLETNSNPGLDDDDAYGMTLSYKAAGMTFRDFLLEIIASAQRRVKN